MGYELGYRRYFRGSGFLSLAGFYNRYDDLLSVENRAPEVETSPPPTHLVLPLFLRNGIQAETAGMELTGLWDARPWWRWKGSYSFLGLNARRKPGSNDASTVGQLEGDSPSHKVVMQSLFTLPANLELDLTYRYVSALADQKVPAYSTGDARFAWRPHPQWEVSAVGRNLLQPSHVEYGGDPGLLVGIRRAAYLKLMWTSR